MTASRRLAGKTRLDKCRMKNIQTKLDVSMHILDIIKKKRLQWFGHVITKETAAMSTEPLNMNLTVIDQEANYQKVGPTRFARNRKFPY